MTLPSGVLPPYTWSCLIYAASATFLGSWYSPQPSPPNRFSRKIRQTTRFRARTCLLGVR